jgi:hypothetical protein
MMSQLSIHTRGKLLLIWGALLPFIALPYKPDGPDHAVPLVDVPVTVLGSPIGSLVLSYPDIVAGSLAMIGLGLSFLVLSSDEPHKGAGIF